VRLGENTPIDATQQLADSAGGANRAYSENEPLENTKPALLGRAGVPAKPGNICSVATQIDGVLVPGEVLINGTTITRYEAREYDELQFFHIKLESHDVICAEGAPAETLLNVEESAVNFADYLRQ
jgi:hypothetical protein